MLDQQLIMMIFLWLSFLVAILIVIESGLLRRYQGKLPDSPVVMAISMMTSIWGFVVPVALYFLPFEGVIKAVPVVYVIYMFATLVYSFRLVRGKDVPDDPKDIVMPMAYVNFCQSFGMAYIVLCLLALLVHYQVLTLPL